MLRLVASLLLACLIALGAWGQEVRLALVIGQTEYSGDLSRVGQANYEAGLIEDALRAVGFEVTSRRDLTRAELRDTLDDFRIRLEQAGREAVGFVYYTGHGAQHPASQDSYLLGVDAKLRGASDLAAYGVDMKSQRDAFGATGAKAVFLVFDACRNTPAIAGWKTSYKGLSRVEAASDMLIAYSTSLGDVAAEGVYAPVLAEELKRPGRSAVAAFEAAQYRIAQSTGRQQLPWTNNQLYSQVCFSGCEPIADAAPVSPTDVLTTYLGSVVYNEYAAPYGVLDYVLKQFGWGNLEALANSGNAHAGMLIGTAYMSGMQVKRDSERARTYFNASCDAGFFYACANLGWIYEQGVSVDVDAERAAGFYLRACDGGVGLACVNLGTMYGTGKGVDENVDAAKEYHRRACEAGYKIACGSPG